VIDLVYDLVVRNGQIVTEDRVFAADIAVRDGRIVAVGPTLVPKNNAGEIDARGLHILPGLIDIHVHCNEPGRTHWEGFATGTRSLAAGGVTTFFDMPLNSSPPTTTVQALKVKKAAATRAAVIDYGLWAGMVPGNIGQLAPMLAEGAVGCKAFMSGSGIEEFPAVDDRTLLEGMSEIARMGSVLAIHAENEAVTTWLAQSAMVAGRRSAHDYAASRPLLSEIEAITRAAACAQATECRLHVVHVSSGEAAYWADAVRRQGVDMTIETCPHYLALTGDDLEQKHGVAKCAPPVRSRDHVETLWRAVRDGVVDVVASDHSPAPPEMKESPDGDFFAVWGGISGAQTTLNVLLDEGYWQRGLALQTVARVTASNPARRFGLYPTKGVIKVGSDADLCLVDLSARWRLEAGDLCYRHRQSPYLGRMFRGRVVRTLVRGHTVFPDPEDQGWHGQMVSPGVLQAA